MSPRSKEPILGQEAIFPGTTLTDADAVENMRKDIENRLARQRAARWIKQNNIGVGDPKLVEVFIEAYTQPGIHVDIDDRAAQWGKIVDETSKTRRNEGFLKHYQGNPVEYSQRYKDRDTWNRTVAKIQGKPLYKKLFDAMQEDTIPLDDGFIKSRGEILAQESFQDWFNAYIENQPLRTRHAFVNSLASRESYQATLAKTEGLQKNKA